MRRIMGIFFPSLCRLCGERAEAGHELCDSCRDAFVRETFEKCPICGETAARCNCGTDFCKHTVTQIGGRGHISLAFYSKESKERCTDRMIFILKDKGTFADFFANELARAVKAAFDADGISITDWTVTYPPRSARRYSELGFDQSEETAKRIARRLGISCEKTFVRGSGGVIQKELSARERHLNASESLIPMKSRIRHGGRYIIFDDIITSGATVEAMAKNLYFYGAEAVFPISVARSLPKYSCRE